MSDSTKRCVPPCSQPFSDNDPHDYCILCLGERHAVAALEEPSYLYDELSKSWSKPYSSRVFVPTASVYSTIVGAKAQGYTVTLVCYLSPGSASLLKKPALPSRPCRITSTLVGKAFQAAGQAGAALHTMTALQAYQADLLKELGMGEGSIF
ncbi:hypothetical protein PO909_007377 [Leuciscus waleckii]